MTSSEQGAQVFYTVTAQDNVDGNATLDENNILTQDSNAAVYANVNGAPPMQGAGGNTGTMTPSQAPPSQATPPSPNQPVGGGDITITCNPPSGSTFPIGRTVVECEATDSLLNIERNIVNVCINDNDNICESPDGTPAQEDGEPPIIIDEDASSPPEMPLELPLLQAPSPGEQPSEGDEEEDGSNEQSADQGGNTGDVEQDEQNEQTNTLQTGDNTATTTQEEDEDDDDTSGD